MKIRILEPDKYDRLVDTPKYKSGGSRHGTWSYPTNNYQYKSNPGGLFNIGDSSRPYANNKKIGVARDGFSSVYGKDGYDFSHVTNTNGVSHAPKERHINFTGYTEGTRTNKNDYNIIPGNHITSKGMDSETILDVYPIYDSGVGSRYPFAYQRGSKDIIDPYAKGFLEIKR